MRLFIVFLLLPAFCHSQQTIDTEQFFLQGLSTVDSLDAPTRDKVYFPWINEFELRTETRDFDVNSQEYTLRLSPSTRRIRNAQQAFYEELASSPDFDGQERYCELMLSLHEDWLSLYILTENLRVMESMMLVLNDKQTIYERMVGTYQFELEKLINLQTQQSNFEISLNKLEQEREYLLNKYNLQNLELDFGNFVTVEAIAEFLANNVLSADVAGLVDPETEYEKQLLVREIELESSENRQLIDFVQVKYNGPHTDFLRERLSVGLGFQLSNSGNQRLKMQELQIEQEELNRESERDIQEDQAKLTDLELKLRSEIQAFFHFQEVMEKERAQLQRLSSDISQKEGISPLILLEIEERHYSMKLESLKEMEDLLADYLTYLEESNKMCGPAFVNYLSE